MSGLDNEGYDWNLGVFNHKPLVNEIDAILEQIPSDVTIDVRVKKIAISPEITAQTERLVLLLIEANPKLNKQEYLEDLLVSASSKKSLEELWKETDTLI